jgi:hypothetical protein
MKNPVYANGFNAVLHLAKERDFAVQTTKSITRRPYRADQHSYATWYEPLSDPGSIEKAVHWVLGLDGIFLNTAGDIHILPAMLEATSTFQRRTPDEVMEKMVADLAMDPLFV